MFNIILNVVALAFLWLLYSKLNDVQRTVEANLDDINEIKDKLDKIGSSDKIERIKNILDMDDDGDDDE